MPETLVPLTPDWWLNRLYDRLVKRRPEIDFYDAYYRGDHPLPWLAPQARDEFRRILRMTRSNYMGLVVDAQVERITVEGFRFGADTGADKDTWRIFQANNLDSDIDQAILEATIGGTAYTLVAPNPDDEATPHIWIEHASQAIVEFEPGTSRRVRAAGLKVWDDDWTGEIHATLYLPDQIFKFKAKKQSVETAGVTKPRWERREVPNEAWPAPNQLGVVPLVELPNNPRLLTGGISELADLTDIQDRVNKTIADRLITQDYGAFPQKWMSGWPEEDENGNPNPPLDIGRNRVVKTDVTEARFGQWDAAPLDPYSGAKREDVKDIASRSRTPAQYLLGEMSNVNGEAMALDTPIPSPFGLIPIGEIRNGDLVFDERGAVQMVEQAHPVMHGRPCYRITFDDHSTFVVDAGHRWPVVSIPESKRELRGRATRSAESVMTTEDIAATVWCPNGQATHAVKMAEAPDLAEQMLSIDPYVFGVWLGDGSKHNGTLTVGAEDLDATVALLRDAGESVTIREGRPGVFTVTCGRPFDGPRTPQNMALRGRLAAADLLMDKHIPEAYFAGSFKQRLALLQGIMDTDGTVSKHHPGAVSLALYDEKLARDCYRLICSLGHKVALRERVQRTNGREFPFWAMQWNPADTVFRLPRKADKQSIRPTTKPKRTMRTIVSVEPVASVPVRCLTVSGPSHLFLAGVQHVPTHNTLKASESGLVAKVKQRCRPHAEGLEETARLARKAAGLPAGDNDVSMETIFSNPEFRTEGELVDALVKMRSIGLPLEAVWEKWGASPQERERWREMMRQEAEGDPLAALAEQFRQPVTDAGT